MNGGMAIADREVGEEAKLNDKSELDNVPEFTPEENSAESNNLEGTYNNIINDEIEKLAKINKLHLKFPLS